MRLIQRYAEVEAPKSFGGLYADQSQGGLINVGFTDGAAQHLEALRDLFPYPELLRSFPVTQSLAELEATTDRITGDLDALAAEGIDVRAVGPLVPENAVQVAAHHGVISGFVRFSNGSKDGIYSFVQNAQRALNARVRTCCAGP